jgi:RNA polymerase sigma-70 factor, ECF subfamily
MGYWWQSTPEFGKIAAMVSVAASTFDIAFPRLHRMASRLLSGERKDHTLQPTALVSEAFIRLHRLAGRINGDDHFFRLAARIMSRILIDHARTRGHSIRVSLDEIPELLAFSPLSQRSEAAISVSDAFNRLRAMDSSAAEALWLRTVEGFTIEEVATRQAREKWKVRADCEYALEWLSAELQR